MTRTIGYARVSTREQGERWSLEAQAEELTRAGCELVYREAISGTAAKRPQLQRALASLEAGDALGVVTLDRLGRSPLEVIQLLHTLTERGCYVVSIKEGLDTRTAIGRAMAQLVAVFAGMAHAQRQESQAAGIRKRREAGLPMGRPKKLNSAQLEHARKLLEEGESYPTVARLLNCSRKLLYARFPARDLNQE